MVETGHTVAVGVATAVRVVALMTSDLAVVVETGADEVAVRGATVADELAAAAHDASSKTETAKRTNGDMNFFSLQVGGRRMCKALRRMRSVGCGDEATRENEEAVPMDIAPTEARQKISKSGFELSEFLNRARLPAVTSSRPRVQVQYSDLTERCIYFCISF